MRLWDQLAVRQERSSQEEAAPQSCRETLEREMSGRGLFAAAPAAAVGFLHLISSWQQLMLSASCLPRKNIPFPLLKEWIPCPEKRKQIKKITVLPIVLVFWWGLEGWRVVPQPWAQTHQVTAGCVSFH